MRKVLAILIIVILLIAAYVGLWWYKSNHLKHYVVSALEIIQNEKSKDYKIHYEEIVRKGFPFSVEVGITNPQIEWKDNPSKITNDGMMIVGTGLFDSNKFWIKLTGDTTISAQTNPEDPKETNEWLLTGDLLVSCRCLDHLVLDEKFAKEPLADLIEFIDKSFTNLTIEADDLSLIDATKETDGEIFDLNKGVFYVTKTNKEKELLDYTLDFKVRDFVYYPEPNLPEEFQKLFNNKHIENLDLSVLTAPSTFNFVLKSHGTVPAFNHPFYRDPSFATVPTFLVEVDKYEGTQENKFGNSSFYSDLYLEKSKDKALDSALTIDGRSVVTEEHHQALLKFFDQVVDNAQQDKEASKDPYVKFMIDNRDEIKQLLPDFAEFGPIEFQVDFKFQAVQEDSSLDQMLILLKNLYLSSDLYALRLKGELQEKQSPIYNGNLIISLKNYKPLIEDATHYYNHWQELLVKSNLISKEQYPHIPAQTVVDVETFLESISDDPQSPKNPLVITITVENSKQVKIGTLTLPEFISESGKLQAKIKSELYPEASPKAAEPKIEKK